jgi:hypothetical protein
MFATLKTTTEIKKGQLLYKMFRHLLGLFTDAFSTTRVTYNRTITYELERMSKENGEAYFMALPNNFSGATEETHKNLQSR